ncbi:hypothetical protein QCA50_010911 [Cerrena zonata]|uniref:Arrestin-like N-terminal domain-containing protein n=1 Tax=Cerrena zonata TaxID=2478898 RepID=A0AAW0G336_9APHY
MAPQSRPEPMNASPHHPKVKVTLRLGEALSVAGGFVTGKMEMECKADKGLGIGVVMVELFAIEELTSRDHSATSTFFHSRRIFQGPGLPPSNSVHPFPQPGDPPLPPNYYGARRGTTTFLFRFPLPFSSPSSINFGSGLANVRYEARASVGVSWKGDKRLVTDKKEVDVVESFQEEFARTEPEGVVVGENGKFWVQGRVIGGVLIAGQPACVELHVKNHSAKKNSGLSITLTRQLQLPEFPTTDKPPLQISDTLTSVSFRGQEYIIQPGTEGVANLVFDVPRHARGVKGGPRHGDEEEETATAALFEVCCLIDVKLSMGFGRPDIRLDIPVSILHPTAIPQLPPSNPYPLPPIQPYGASTPDILSQVPYALPSSPAPVYPPLSPPPVMSYMDPSHHWIPPPSHSPVPMAYYPYAPNAPSFYQPMLSPPPPHVIPMRPASAEPIPSQPLYNIPSGLPVSVQQPLSASGDIPPLVMEREEGKGERASRISHHLRMSSRNRSVSPQAHRYSQPTDYAPPFIPTPASNSPSPSNPRALQTLDIPAAVASSPSSDVVSPRPMLSPKQSFSVDPVRYATLSKSDRVRTLEHMAAQAEKTNSDMSTVIPEVNFADKDKSLPIPPVPSDKQKPRSGMTESRPRADTFFPPDQQLEETPRTPTIAAVASLKVPRFGGGDGGLSGLDALEARLIAEVGTKKPEQNNQKPDVRSILPQPIDIPRPSADIEPAVDSAISSLRLPGVEVESKEPVNDSLVVERAESTHSNDGARTERGRAKERISDGLTKKSAGKKSTRKGKDHVSAERDGEIHRMRKVARGRVADWLERIDPAVPPDVDSSASPSPAPERAPDKAGRKVEQESQDTSPAPLPDEDKPKAEGNTDSEDVVAQPNPRSSGFIPIETLRARQMQAETSAKKEGRVEEKPFGIPRGFKFPVYPPRPLDPQAHYDIRSARGGRGGKVTAVAAIWASQTQATREQSKSPPPVKLTKVVKSTPKYLSSQPVKPPPARTPPAVARTPMNHLPTSSQPASFSAANLTEKRAKMIKSTSVPAVLSSSLATPMLSSTASLARPSPPLMDRAKSGNKLLPTVSETYSSGNGRLESSTKSAPAPKGDLAFGQARLRELIKRYQGQTS